MSRSPLIAMISVTCCVLVAFAMRENERKETSVQTVWEKNVRFTTDTIFTGRILDLPPKYVGEHTSSYLIELNSGKIVSALSDQSFQADDTVHLKVFNGLSPNNAFSAFLWAEKTEE